MVTACRNPFIKDGLAFPCGNCEPCLWNRRQLWAFRLQMEAMCHEHSAFVTLTYSDGELPVTAGGVATLAPEHLRSWLKVIRERERVEGRFFRFYAVGEYGDKTHRPHYHLVLFGFKPCDNGRTRSSVITGERDWRNCCDRCRLVGDTWARGIVEVGEVNRDSCGYIAGYVMKKMTRYDDPRLNGRNPEFARMSNRGGLGLPRISDIAEGIKFHGLEYLDTVALLSGNTRKPLGRYLTRKLREALGKAPDTPKEVLEALAAELLPLREAAFDASRSFKEEVKAAGQPRYDDFMAKRSLYAKRRML